MHIVKTFGFVSGASFSDELSASRKHQFPTKTLLKTSSLGSVMSSLQVAACCNCQTSFQGEEQRRNLTHHKFLLLGLHLQQWKHTTRFVQTQLMNYCLLKQKPFLLHLIIFHALKLFLVEFLPSFPSLRTDDGADFFLAEMMMECMWERCRQRMERARRCVKACDTLVG